MPTPHDIGDHKVDSYSEEVTGGGISVRVTRDGKVGEAKASSARKAFLDAVAALDDDGEKADDQDSEPKRLGDSDVTAQAQPTEGLAVMAPQDDQAPAPESPADDAGPTPEVSGSKGRRGKGGVTEEQSAAGGESAGADVEVNPSQ